MTVKLTMPANKELKPRITVLGIGGAGGNAVNNMISARLEGVSFVVANTDAQALAQSKADIRIQLGPELTEGLGAGAKPDVGRGAAEESLAEILEHLTGSHMVFVTAGMGGGTGTGAAPVIARAIRDLGILTVGVVTKPFHFEGDRRMKLAERGIEELQNYVDTLIIIPNQNLFRISNERTTFAQAFTMADEVLHSGVRGVTDLIVMPGLINRDFADIKTVMSEMGKAMMGTGEMSGEGRALRAAEAAISNPLLDDVSMKGARAVLVNVTGGPDLGLFEVDEAVNRIRAEVDPDANILFGSALSVEMEGRVRVSVVATGIDAESFIRASDNVEKFPTRRKALDLDPPNSAASAFSRVQQETSIAASSYNPSSNLARDIFPPQAQAIAAPQHFQGHSAFAPADVEPMILGGAEAPMLEDTPVQPERRGMFGMFGSRRRVEPEAAPPMRPAPKAVAQTLGMPPQVATPQAARPNDGRPQMEPERQDLFGGETENDRFEIPAFLRKQQVK